MEIIIKTQPGRTLQRKSDPLEPLQDGESLITTNPKKYRNPTYTVTSTLPSNTYALKQWCPAAETPFVGKIKEGLTDLFGSR